MRAVTPAFPEQMEHWSKTSLSEPQPLGRHKRRERNDDAGASRAGSGKVLKLLNAYPVSRKVPGDFSAGEEKVSAGKLKRRERVEDDAGGFNGGSGKSLKTTNVSPASLAKNGGCRSSGGDEMTRFSSASRRESTNVRRDWPSGTAPKVDHRPRNVSALSPPREGMTRKGVGQESISKSGKIWDGKAGNSTSLVKKAGNSTSLVNKAGNSTSMVKIGMPSTSSAKVGSGSTKCQQKASTKTSEPRRMMEMVKAEKSAAGMQIAEPRRTEWTQARESVMTMLKSYRDHCKDLEKDKSKLDLVRVDLVSCDMVKIEFPHLLQNKAIIGPVPGIEVGDRFTYRTELRLARMHRPLQCGIDTTEDARGNRIAVSIVDSGRYENYMSSLETLVYCAQGSSADNQKKRPVNLAMMKSKELKTPVRVIKTRKEYKSNVYFYDGLYTVEDMWEDRDVDGKRLKFKLVRMPGQPSSLGNRKPSS